MPILHNSIIAATTADDPVTRSLRFNGSVSSSEAGHLYRTAGTPTDEGKWTMSMWVKVGQQPTNGYMTLFGAGASNDNAASVSIYNGTLYADQATSSNHRTIRCSERLLRDPNAWYHLCFAYDNSQSGSSGNNQNAYKWYVNGVRLTEPTYSNNESVTGYTHRFNSSGYIQRIGKYAHRSYNSTYKYHWDGLIADVHFVDGQQLEPTEFIEANDYGGYIPKEYTGTYGNNGFHIDAQPAHDADLLVSSIDRNNGDTTFADAAQGHGLTVSGDTEHSIAVGNPFTGDDRAIYFDGSSALTIPDSTDWEPSGDFTYEAWIMPTWSSAPAYAFPFGHGSSDGQDVNMGHGVLIKNGTLYLTGWFGSTYHHPNYSSSGSGFAVSANEWTHVAVVRDGNTIRYYKNGVQQSTFTVSGSATAESNVFALGRSGSLTSYPYTGYIADFRITHDAEYPSGTTFTTPTAPHSTTSDTKVRIQPQLSDTTWHDEEGNHTISTVGSPTRTASSPYDAAAKSTAIYIPASSNYSDSNYLETSVSTDFSVGTGAYTLEGWIYIPTDYTGNFTPFGHYGADITMHGKTIACYGATLGSQASSTSVDIGEWKHVAVVRESTSSNGAALYYDGNRIHLFTNSVNLNAAVEVALSGQNGQYWNQTAYYYDVRLTKGTARYTGSTYTVPSAPFELNPVYIGGDQSGNKNHFQPTNISGHDVMLDVPYPKNYATLNPLDAGGGTFSEGNLKWKAGGSHRAVRFTQAALAGGKTYFEVYYPDSWSNQPMIGLMGAEAEISDQQSANPSLWFRSNGYEYNNGSESNAGNPTWTNGDIVGVAVDLSAGELKYRVNNGSFTTAFTGLSSSTTWIPAIKGYDTSPSYILNTGADPTFAGNKTSGQDTSQGEFYYAPPTGFKSLNSSNLDDPTAIPSENFGVALYNGTSSSNSITGLGFQPDVLWTKSRSTSGSSPKIFDSIRGVTKRLQPDQTAVEQTVTELTSFDSDGFTLGSDSGSNYSGRTYAAWNWKAHQSDARTSYTVRVEDAGGDAWDSYGSYYDSSTYLPSVYMEIYESRNGTLASLGKVAVRSYDANGNSMSNLSQQDYTLKCMNLDAIAVRWYYDTSGDGQEYDYPCSYNDYLNEQKITIQGGNWTTNNHSNDDGCTDYDYSAPTGWANGDSLKTATTSYNGTDTATLHASWESAPTEKYNAGAGFTIISYSGHGSSDGDTQNINHSLGVPLEFVLAKNRTNSNGNTNGDWIVWHKDLPSNKFLKLNSNQTTRTSSYGDLISTAVSGSQHQVVVANDYDSNSGSYHYLNDGGYYGSPEEYILYGWASTAGACKVGSYEGNGSSDGPFIAMDFAPAFFLYTNIDSSEHWYITDNKRPSYNVSSRKAMFAGHSNAESSESRYQMDFLSNGVKIRATHAKTNANNKTYLYLAMAEMPFKYGNGK